MDAFEAISLPEPASIAGKKHFTLAEANRSLILVRRIVSDIVDDYKQLRELHETYQARDEKGDVTGAENARQRYVAVTDHLSELREELEDIGCELKDFEAGLVDFPSLRDGREIFFCWKLGEDKVGYWHTVTSGFSGRRPIEKKKVSPISPRVVK